MQIRKSFDANLKFFVETMLSLQKGTTVDVYYNAESGTVAVGAAAGGVKLVSVTGVDDKDLESHYDLRRKGDHYEYDDGYAVQVIPRAELAAYVANQINSWKSDGGAEWGWEFTFHWDDDEVLAIEQRQRQEAERATREAQKAAGAQARAAALQAVGKLKDAIHSGQSAEERRAAALQVMEQLNPQLKEAMLRKAQPPPPEGREPLA